MLSCEFCEFFKNTLFYRTSPVAASVSQVWYVLTNQKSSLGGVLQKNEEVVEGSFLERDSSADVFLQILRKCLGQFFQKTSVRAASEDLPY